jgi:Flp pilus assembly protein TadG
MSFVRRFGRCARGVSATEFALTMPVFIIVIGGLVTIGQAQSAVQNTTLVASTIADLTSQLQTATPADIADEFAVATIMMAPLPTAPLSIRVTSAVPVMSGTTVVNAAVGWCQAYNGGLPCSPPGTVIGPFQNGAQVPLGMLTGPGTSFVITEVAYNYAPAASAAIPNGIQIYKVKFLAPRTVSQVTCATC